MSFYFLDLAQILRFTAPSQRRDEDDNTCGSHNYGLGYGVVIGPGSVTIEANVFDHNRHDIASDGQPGSHYTATYNLVLAGRLRSINVSRT